MSDPISIHASIIGRVQGVFYRDSTQREAQKLGLTGWVRNKDDGSVEAVFCGERESVEQMLIWCKKGPPAAHVSEINTSEIPFEQHEQFIIRYD